MNEVFQTIAPHLVELVGALVAGLIAWLSVEVKKWISAKVQSETARGAMNAAINGAALVVSSLEKTIVSSAKVAVSDGKISKAEYDKILQDVKAQAVDTVGNMVKAQFPKVAGDLVSAVAEHAVESAVLQRSDLQKALGMASPGDPIKP
jgi:hypothetical protein